MWSEPVTPGPKKAVLDTLALVLSSAKTWIQEQLARKGTGGE
jgi:hypothetical protein